MRICKQLITLVLVLSLIVGCAPKKSLLERAEDIYEKDLDKAMSYIEDYLEEDEYDLEAYELLGEIYVEEEDYNELAKLIISVLKDIEEFDDMEEAFELSLELIDEYDIDEMKERYINKTVNAFDKVINEEYEELEEVDIEAYIDLVMEAFSTITEDDGTLGHNGPKLDSEDDIIEDPEIEDTEIEVVIKEPVNLTLFVNIYDYNFKGISMVDLIESFEEEYDYITIDLLEASSEYNYDLKMMNESGILPDVFVLPSSDLEIEAYSLVDLSQESWVDHISKQVKHLAINKDGEVYALPLSYQMNGIVYNKTVLDEAGVNPLDIRTWDDFYESLEKVQKIGKYPYLIADGEEWGYGILADIFLSSYLFGDGREDYVDEFNDGMIPEELVSQGIYGIRRLQDYWSSDLSELYFYEIAEYMANDEVGFAFYGNYMDAMIKDNNEFAEIGFIPVPSISGDPTVIIYASDFYAIPDTSEHIDEAKLFLEFLSRSENVKTFSSNLHMQAGINIDHYDEEKELYGYNYGQSLYGNKGLIDKVINYNIWYALIFAADNAMNYDYSIEEILQGFKDELSIVD